MASVRDVAADKLISRVADELSKLEEMAPPEWSKFAKTGMHKERPPEQENWWHIRAASMLRKLYLSDASGVSEFRKQYGGRKNRGHKPEHKVRASGAVIRTILQQLGSAGLVKSEKGKVRTISPKGMSLLDKISKEK